MHMVIVFLIIFFSCILIDFFKHFLGNIIKPQILMSSTSVIGRVASGQVRDMVSEPNRAFGKNGEIIAPLGYNVHYIEASNKLVNSTVRNDAMTNQNGFDCNQLCMTSLLLCKQNPLNNIDENKRLSYLINLLHGRGIKFNFQIKKIT